MTEILLALFSQLNSSVFVLLVLLVAVGYGIFYIGRWKEKFGHQDEKLKELKDISRDVTELKVKTDIIYQNVVKNSPIKAFSPLSLTDVGKEIAKNIDADVIFNKYSDALSKEVEKKCPGNAYDIQTVSIEVARTHMQILLTFEELIKMKSEAFAKGILVEDVMSIFGLLLRDHILKVKNIPVTDVDKHAPTYIKS